MSKKDIVDADKTPVLSDSEKIATLEESLKEANRQIRWLEQDKHKLNSQLTSRYVGAWFAYAVVAGAIMFYEGAQDAGIFGRIVYWGIYPFLFVILLFGLEMLIANFIDNRSFLEKTPKRNTLSIKQNAQVILIVAIGVGIGILYCYFLYGANTTCSSCGKITRRIDFENYEYELHSDIHENVCKDCIIEKLAYGEYDFCTHCYTLVYAHDIQFGVCHDCLSDVRVESNFGYCERCGKVVEQSRMELGLCDNCIDYAIEDEYGSDFIEYYTYYR